MKKARNILRICVCLVLFAGFALKSAAQSDISSADSLALPADSSLYAIRLDSVAIQNVQKAAQKQFIPDPKRALWLAIVCPGAGQIYNRKYWKLPIFYGGFVGCTYALIWNQMMYKDYAHAYQDISDDDPTTNSFMDMLPPHYDITGRESHYKTLFKNRKDRYRRYRDLSAFAFVAVYALSVVDAYVDAHLSVFDITPDLSMSVQPAVISRKEVARTSASYGFGVGLNF